jgi:hypothetical protein
VARQLVHCGQEMNLLLEMRESEFPSIGPSSELHLIHDGGDRSRFPGTVLHMCNDGSYDLLPLTRPNGRAAI